MLFGCFGCFALQAQQPKSIYTNEEVSISSITTRCHDKQNGIHQEKVLLSFTNTSANAIEVSFERNLWYDDVPLNVSEGERRRTVRLNAGATIAGSCDSKDKALFVFSKHLDLKGKTLTKFSIDNISVKAEAHK